MIEEIPKYVDEMIYGSGGGAMGRITNAKLPMKGHNIFSFAHMTDIHGCWEYVRRALYAVDKIDEEHPISFVCMGGDYLNNNPDTTPEEALAQHKVIRSIVGNFRLKDITMITNGNHDSNPFDGKEKKLTHKEVYETLMYHHKDCFVCNPEEPYSMYGYYDLPEVKARAIFLDTWDRPPCLEDEKACEGFLIGNGQLNWFAHTALDLPDKDWGVMLFSHVLPVPSAVMNDRVFGGDALWEVLCAFKNGTAYQGSGQRGAFSYAVECDFSGRGKGDVIACFVGHIHADRKAMVDGIRAISALSMASDNFAVRISDDNTFHDKTLGSIEESAFSVFTVDRTARKIHCIRCGAGPDYSVDY